MSSGSSIHHSHHTYDHAHDAAHDHDHVEANKKYFNNSDFSLQVNEHAVFLEFANTVSAAIREVFPFDPSSPTALDFACGTGLSTRAYAPFAHAKGLADKMSGVCSELKGAEGELYGAQFDVCIMAYQHFASAKDITSIITRFLKPGGMLLVVDIEVIATIDSRPLVIEGLQNLDYIPHKRGFQVEEGLVSLNMERLTHVTLGGRFDVDTLLARGVRPSEK
ncbi:hypothetical protein J3R30DRAFT_3709830 [Lentinula aciculospora]|uniref:S-adenosyl-L-methionine-dependent methyltransferase n=1 Tax=Lentinula aciculospora TaxID=153920 RepID=A0A9W9DHZ6_9AGAR|nr:hypothetical protein J3R30DRAFT_3709830 [Lentinula aciculospora]